MAQRYAIADHGEVQADLSHPLLGARCLECVKALQDLVVSDPIAVLGGTDAVKLRSSRTLVEVVRAVSCSTAATSIVRWGWGKLAIEGIGKKAWSGMGEREVQGGAHCGHLRPYAFVGRRARAVGIDFGGRRVARPRNRRA